MTTLNDLIKFEHKYNLKERKILNLNYWDFCRMNFFYEIKSKCNDTGLIADLCRNITPKERKLNIKFIKKYFHLHKKSDLLFITDPRRVKQKDYYESIFIDTITNFLKEKYKIMTLEEPSWRALGCGMPPHFHPTNSVNLKYTDLYEYKFLIKKCIFIKFSKAKLNNITSELNYIYSIIKKEFNVDISNTINAFRDIIIYFIVMEKTYERLIKKINPKIVLLNYRPTFFKMLINTICRKNNIITIDLQHGVITKDDPLDRKNPEGFDWLTTSDYLFAYGEKLANKKNLCFYDKNIKYVGFPFLEKRTKSNIKKPPMLEDGYKYILIISQSIMGERFANFAEKLSEKLINNPEYKIIFKYHPNELNNNYDVLNKKNIIQVKSLDFEIYQFQKYCCCQLGSYSTGLFEGLSFLIPTIILKNFPGARGTIEILKYLKKGIYIANDENDIVYILRKLESPDKNDIDLLWKKNSLLNIQTEIENIIKNMI